MNVYTVYEHRYRYGYRYRCRYDIDIDMDICIYGCGYMDMDIAHTLFLNFEPRKAQ